MDFYTDGQGWDGDSQTPGAYEVVSFTVANDGHALALWEQGRTLAVSVRDPAKKQFGAPKTLVTRDFDPSTIADPQHAQAWLNPDGSFTVVVIERTKLSRFTIGADGTIGAPIDVHTFEGPSDTTTPLYVQVAERQGVRLVTWRSFGATAALFGSFVDATGAWSDPVSIGPGATDFRFRWVSDIASNGKAIALLEPLDATNCATPALRHYSAALGWGDVAIAPAAGCVSNMTAGIAEDGSVSTLMLVGANNADKHVIHAVAR